MVVMEIKYGAIPEPVALFASNFSEFMHYQYLPVAMPGVGEFRIPERLEFLEPMVKKAYLHEAQNYFNIDGGIEDRYVYLTARFGWASPENPLNRPGWHCDGFGTEDTNYIWWAGAGTRFAFQDFDSISVDHEHSMEQFESQIDPECVFGNFPSRILYRLNPYVVHATPVVEPPGHMRSFVKISISRHRYNLMGNSHNYLFDYDWKMFPRDAVRNDPHYAEADFVLEEP